MYSDIEKKNKNSLHTLHIPHVVNAELRITRLAYPSLLDANNIIIITIIVHFRGNLSYMQYSPQIHYAEHDTHIAI